MFGKPKSSARDRCVKAKETKMKMTYKSVYAVVQCNFSTICPAIKLLTQLRNGGKERTSLSRN